jgi:membrane protease YdiL (CAAX protease family)
MFVSTAIVGWILGWLALEYDSIWPGFVIHAGFNLVAGVGVMAMEKLPHEVHGPLLLALLAVLVGLSVIVGIRERKLINRVIFEPLRQTPRPPGLWRPLGAIFRLWPVTVQTAISLIAWVAMLVDLPQTLQ